MHPILYQNSSITLYTYGFFIAIGAFCGFLYMTWQGKKQFSLTFDQSNTLFILLVIAGVLGGKFFIVFENPDYYFANISQLFSGSGFVFYGSLLTTIPVMLWYFKKVNVPVGGMLDIMAVVTCLVHGFGRIGCYMAGCCYGLPTNKFWGVTFTNPMCQADPLHTALHPTQLYEATLIFSILMLLLFISKKKKFNGQLFLIYLIIYAFGRSILEIFRGDINRGFLIDNVLSNAQFLSLLIIVVAIYYYVKLKRKANLYSHS